MDHLDIQDLFSGGYSYLIRINPLLGLYLGSQKVIYVIYSIYMPKLHNHQNIMLKEDSHYAPRSGSTAPTINTALQSL